MSKKFIKQLLDKDKKLLLVKNLKSTTLMSNKLVQESSIVNLATIILNDEELKC